MLVSFLVYVKLFTLGKSHIFPSLHCVVRWTSARPKETLRSCQGHHDSPFGDAKTNPLLQPPLPPAPTPAPSVLVYAQISLVQLNFVELARPVLLERDCFIGVLVWGFCFEKSLRVHLTHYILGAAFFPQDSVSFW